MAGYTTVEYGGFNGAVTFSLRKCANLEDANLTGADLLQWGRNFFVTEIYIQLVHLELQEKLQWGRNFFVTEIVNIFSTT